MVTVAMDTVVTGLATSQCPSTPVAQGVSDRVVSVSTIFIKLINVEDLWQKIFLMILYSSLMLNINNYCSLG